MLEFEPQSTEPLRSYETSSAIWTSRDIPIDATTRSLVAVPQIGAFPETEPGHEAGRPATIWANSVPQAETLPGLNRSSGSAGLSRSYLGSTRVSRKM